MRTPLKVFAAVLLAQSAGAWSAEQPRTMIDMHGQSRGAIIRWADGWFVKIDRNGDGKFDSSEYAMAPPPFSAGKMTLKTFDRNRDGIVTRREFRLDAIDHLAGGR